MFWSTSIWILVYIYVDEFCRHRFGMFGLECFSLHETGFR